MGNYHSYPTHPIDIGNLLTLYIRMEYAGAILAYDRGEPWLPQKF